MNLEKYDVKTFWQSKTERLEKWAFTKGWWLIIYFSAFSLTHLLFGYIAAVLFIAALDILLTHMTMRMIHHKKGIWDFEREINWLPRKTMKLFGGIPNPHNFLIGAGINITIISILLLSSEIIGQKENFVVMGFVGGIIFITNIYHIHNITEVCQ